MFDTSADFISPEELAARWNNRLSPDTLERWRRDGIGPDYYKLGGKVLYRLSHVRAFEDQQRRRCRGDFDSKSVRAALATLDALDGEAA